MVMSVERKMLHNDAAAGLEMAIEFTHFGGLSSPEVMWQSA